MAERLGGDGHGGSGDAPAYLLLACPKHRPGLGRALLCRFVDNLHETRVNAGNLSSGLPSHLKRILASRLALPRIGAASDFASLEQHVRGKERGVCQAAGNF